MQIQNKEEASQYDHLLVSSFVRKGENLFKEFKKEFVDKET